MRRLATALCVAVVALLMVVTTCVTSDAFDYLGDYCFPYTCTGGVSGTLKLGLFDLGGNHYMVSGLAIQSTPTFGQVVVHGNGELIGGSLQFTLTQAASVGTSAATAVSHFVINLSSPVLAGTLKGILLTVNPNNVAFGSCTTTFAVCPSLP